MLQNFRVGELWFRDSDAGLAPILEEAGRRHVTLRPISPGDSLKLGETVFDMLASAADSTGVSNGGTNPLSMRVTSGQATALLVSGASVAGQKQVLQSNGAVRTLVLATGRHVLVQVMDSNRPTNRDAAIALANASRTVLQNDALAGTSLIESGYRTFATDRDGAVTVEMQGAAVRIAAFANQP
jgi:beta-lactamase superfamily II metal-dependent hydrolase